MSPIWHGVLAHRYDNANYWSCALLEIEDINLHSLFLLSLTLCTRSFFIGLLSAYAHINLRSKAGPTLYLQGPRSCFVFVHLALHDDADGVFQFHWRTLNSPITPDSRSIFGTKTNIVLQKKWALLRLHKFLQASCDVQWEIVSNRRTSLPVFQGDWAFPGRRFWNVTYLFSFKNTAQSWRNTSEHSHQSPVLRSQRHSASSRKLGMTGRKSASKRSDNQLV